MPRHVGTSTENLFYNFALPSPTARITLLEHVIQRTGPRCTSSMSALIRHPLDFPGLGSLRIHKLPLPTLNRHPCAMRLPTSGGDTNAWTPLRALPWAKSGTGGPWGREDCLTRGSIGNFYKCFVRIRIPSAPVRHLSARFRLSVGIVPSTL